MEAIIPVHFKRLICVWILLVIYSAYSFEQYISLDSGSLILHEGVISLNSTSFINNDEIITNKETALSILGNQLTYMSGYSEFSLHTLKLGTDCTLNTDLTIIDSIVLNNGNLDLSNSFLNLEGIIQGEKESGRILSSGNGEIIKLFNLQADREENPGNMGLTINAGSDIVGFELRRGHQQSDNSNKSSIKRYFSLTPINGEYNVTFNYFDAELGPNEENNLKLWGETDNVWESIAEYNTNTEANSLSVGLNTPYEKFTLFSGEQFDISIPKGFSPNGDGINDQFVILGAENFPQNKLIVFNQWGEVVFEAAPYANDWEGESDFRLASQQDKKLFDGTYFYFFYTVSGDNNSVKKGFVELKSNLD